VPTVLIASCADLTCGDGHDDDEPLLLSALADAGIDADTADWADPGVEWSAADAVVVRSTWDYAPRRDEFVAWACRVEETTPLYNPAEVLAWNTDKRYLRELAAAGLPVVPTAWVERDGQVGAALAPWTGDVVVKPAVSAGARDTARFTAGDPAAAEHARRVLAGGRAVMVQPYLARLDAEGETGLVYLDGVYSHAFGKAAILTGGPLGTGLYAPEVLTAREASDEQRALGDRVLAWVAERAGAPLLYARIDLVPGDGGAPQVIEVELTEPSLVLSLADGAAAGFAAAVAARLA
jgi:glutathione synthase/RimK-type ligase-like ATP-grasp enzyme